MEKNQSVMAIREYGRVHVRLREVLEQRQMKRNALAKAAKERGINLETAAEAYGNHVDMLPDFDLVVLAPQAASYLADLQKDCERVGNKCVACRGKQYIELSQNGDKSLAFVSEQLSK